MSLAEVKQGQAQSLLPPPSAPMPPNTIPIAPQVAQALSKTTLGKTVLASPRVVVTPPRTPTPTVTQTTTPTIKTTLPPNPLDTLISKPKETPASQPAPVVTTTPIVKQTGSLLTPEKTITLGLPPNPISQLITRVKEQQATEAKIEAIPPERYYEQFGVRPKSPEYYQAISDIQRGITDVESTRQQVIGSPEGTKFLIGGTTLPLAPNIQSSLSKSNLGRTLLGMTTKRYTKEEAEQYFSKQIEELTTSKRTLEEYQEKGYKLNITDKGYTISGQKASDVAREYYGREPTEAYLLREMGTGFLGVGMLGAIAGEAITGRPAVQEHYEETAQSLLSGLRRKGESQEAYTARFWNPIENPEVLMNVYLPVITLGGSKLITTAGKVFAPELVGMGSKISGLTSKASSLTDTLPRSVKYAGFRAGFAGKTALYNLSTPIGQTATKYGFYGLMEAPVLIETATTNPELLLSRIGSSLGQYEMFTAQLETGGRILQKGIKDIRSPEYANRPSFSDRYGLRTLGDEAIQPVPGLRMKGRLSEMTAKDIEGADIKLAQSYKEPKTRGLSLEDAQLDSLSQSFNKKQVFKDFLRDETGGQPLPGARRFTSSKGMTEKELSQADDMLARSYKEPKPRATPEDAELNSLSQSFNKSFGAKKEIKQPVTIKAEPLKEDIISIPKGYKTKYEPKYETFDIGKTAPKKQGLMDKLLGSDEGSASLLGRQPKVKKKPVEPIKETPSSKELLFTDTTGRTTNIEIYEPFPHAQVLTEKTPGVGTLFEEFPRKGGTLEIGEITKPGKRLTIPGSYEQEVTRLGIGKRRLDLIEAQPGKPTGRLIADESKHGTLTMAEVTPGERTQFEGLMAVRRTTPVSKIGLGKNEPSLIETMPLTKEQAVEYQAQRLKTFITPKQLLKPEIKKMTQEFYNKPVKPSPYDVRGVISDTDIMGLEIRQARKENIFDIGRDLKSKVDFYGNKYNKISFGGAEPKYAPSELRGKVNKLLWEDKGTPELRATYIGKRGRTSVTMKEEPLVPVGTRPKEGWGEYLKGVQTTDIETLQYTEGIKRQIRGKALEDKTVRPTSTGRPSTPFKYERPIETKIGGETTTVKGGDTGLVSVTKKGTTRTEERFKPSGLYESPNIQYVTMDRPLTRQEFKLLSNVEKDTGGISAYWGGTRPRMTKQIVDSLSLTGGGLLLTGLLGETKTQGRGLLTGLGTERLTSTGMLTLTGRRTGELTEQKKDKLTDLFSGQRFTDITDQGFREIQEQRQSDKTISLQNQEQMQEQRQDQMLKQEQETKNELRLIQRTPQIIKEDDMFKRYNEEKNKLKLFIPKIPPRKKDDEQEYKKYMKEPADKTSYHVEVKERGMYGGKVMKGIKFVRATKKPLTREQAMSYGAEITDTGSAVSFRLRKTKERPEQLDKPIKDYGSRSYKFRQKGNVFIEKPDYRMDTPGELEQVSALGQEARRNKGNYITNTSGHLSNHRQRKNYSSDIFRLSTPRNRSTGLLSTKTKIKETGLFKKNKRGKNNAYY